jgi:hypothetical protein
VSERRAAVENVRVGRVGGRGGDSFLSPDLLIAEAFVAVLDD